MPAQVFLSYASEDRDRAGSLADALTQQGWTVFWDRTIAPGMVFDEVIGDALRGAGCVVVLWSRASIVSSWVKEEADDGAQRNILVPALIDDVALPLGFRRVQAARLVGWPTRHDPGEFQQFSDAIARRLRDAPSSPRTAPRRGPPGRRGLRHRVSTGPFRRHRRAPRAETRRRRRSWRPSSWPDWRSAPGARPTTATSGSLPVCRSGSSARCSPGGCGGARSLDSVRWGSYTPIVHARLARTHVPTRPHIST